MYHLSGVGSCHWDFQTNQKSGWANIMILDFNFFFKALQQMIIFGIWPVRAVIMSDPRKDFVGHRQVPVNVVQSRLLIVSMGEGDSRTGDLEGSGACTQWGLVKTHICNPHLRDIVTKVHTERASKARKVGRERIEWRHPSASENLGHISLDVGRDDNTEYLKLYDNDPYWESPQFSIQYEKRNL